MAKRRKKFAVDDLRAIANRLLSLPDNPDVNNDFRRGIIAIIEETLMNAKAYAGFNYHEWLNGGYEQWVKAGSPDFPVKHSYIGNQYRRFYY